VNQSPKLALLGIALSLAACSSIDGEKVDYRGTVKAPSLDVPPDLTQLSKDTRYTVVGGAVSASGFQAAQPGAGKATVAASAMGDVRVERLGTQRWLVVNRPADKLWEPVKEFWQDNGFSLVQDQSTVGVMETEWAENRAKIPQDFIRTALGKVLDGLYSTSERDKFRTRLERDANGNTEIYISHRGMMEVYKTEQKDTTVWQPRAADPELESEFLRRLMVKLGSTKEQAAAQVATSTASAVKSASSVSSINGQPVVLIEEGFDRAWRRVGLALDRTGFTVEDRDRKQGTYFVRYVSVGGDAQEPGFFSKLFSSSSKTIDATKYQITVKSQGDMTTVAVQDAKGAADSSANAQRIVKLIADDIK
jgi:outer membrane protein assembly factor BamC